MKQIIDLHIHSCFSRATSKQLNLEGIYKWGKIKGIDIVATGDYTHPEWFNELQKKLIPAEPGLFKLDKKIAKEIDAQLPEKIKKREIRYILSTEISCIYSKNDKVRKMHNVILMPDFKSVAEFNSELDKIGNLKSDGRPILGLDSKKLLEIVLNIIPSVKKTPSNYISPQGGYLIPAHIWTPWFSMFGSKSGFDTIEECFEELTPEIKTVETGLSSDPFMNWRLKQLEGITLVSNSDAHSPQKLGREANLLDCEKDYNDIIGALKTNDKRIIGTIEFYPQEGKYHFDGHRKCDISFAPHESKKHDNLCPKCGKLLVLGVNYRVEDLADYAHDYTPKTHKKVEYIVPLPEIIAEIAGIKSTNSKTVTKKYNEIISKFGDEFSILRYLDLEELRSSKENELALAIKKMREGDIYIKPGYDGVYGEVKIL